MFAVFASADPSPSEELPIFVLKFANIEIFNLIFFLTVIVLNYLVVRLFDLIAVDANDIFRRFSVALSHFLMNLLRERTEHHRIIGRRRHEREILDDFVLIENFVVFRIDIEEFDLEKMILLIPRARFKAYDLLPHLFHRVFLFSADEFAHLFGVDGHGGLGSFSLIACRESEGLAVGGAA